MNTKQTKTKSKAAQLAEQQAGRMALAQLVSTRGSFFEVCPNKLYLVLLKDGEDRRAYCKELLQSHPTCPFRLWPFRETTHITYEAFNCDFGPLNLSATHMFCSKIKVWTDTIKHHEFHKYIAVVLDQSCGKRNLNVSLATAIAGMVLYGLSGDQAVANIKKSYCQPLTVSKQIMNHSFVDVTGAQTHLTLAHSIQAFYMALQLGFYNYYEFDQIHYLYYETVVSGDLNWIVPGKILAFAGPSDKINNSRNYYRHSPRFYHDYFRKNNITTIIRLNEPEYESKEFTDYGFEHFDLIFPDGFAPSRVIAEKFIKIVYESKGAVAVHCYAGIGRTGTLIAAYLMTKYDFSAARAIAWTRICRPGSIIGEQELWLRDDFDKRLIAKIKTRHENQSDLAPVELQDDKNSHHHHQQQLQANSVDSHKLDSKHNSQGDNIDCECDEQVDSIDAANSSAALLSQQPATSYELAAKTLGQAKALVMTKRQRKGAEKAPNTRKSKAIAEAAAAAAAGTIVTTTTPTKISTTKAVAVTPASPNSTINSTTQFVLDLGTTIPFNFYIEDFVHAKNDCPDTYRMHDHGIQWPVKFPKSEQVALRYGKAMNKGLDQAKNLPDLVVKEPILDCCLVPGASSGTSAGEHESSNILSPVIFFGSDVI